MNYLSGIVTKAEPSKEAPIQGATTDTKDQDIFKAYIPNFLYKPPFGMPRRDNTPQLKKLGNNPYVFSVIKTLCDEASSTGWEIKVKEEFQEDEDITLKAEEVDPEKEDNESEDKETPVEDEDKKPGVSLDYEDEIKKATKFFKNPNGNEESLNHIIRQVITDIEEVDAGVIVKIFNQAGEFKQMFSRDGSLFLKNPDIYGYIGNRKDFVSPLPDGFTGVSVDQGGSPTPGQQQIMKQYSLLYKEDAAYFQYGWTAGSMPVPFGKREICYIMQNPRADSIYGRSPTSVLMNTIFNLIYGIDFNLDYYTNNNMPDGAIQLLGASAAQITQFRENFEAKFKFTDDFGKKRKIFNKVPISSTPVTFTPFQLSSKDMEIIAQQEWFTKILWMCYGVTADEMGFCYSADTRVLTNNGLKYYDELEEEDKIATVVNSKIEYIKPTEIHTFDVKDRKFHHYQNKNIDLLVSDDHRMHYKTEKVDEWKMSPSNEIELSRVKFQQGGLGWEGKDKETFSIPLIEYENNKDKGRNQLTEFDMDDFCEFMGYYLSEGSVIKAANDRKQYAVKISQTKDTGIKVMKPIMDKLGFRRDKTNWTLNDKSLATYLLQFGGSNQKYIPKELKYLPNRKLRILLNALIEGDGIIDEQTNAIRYSTSSKKLSEDVFEIMLKLGYSTKIRIQEFENKNWNTHYYISGNLTNINPNVDIKNHREIENYTGVMWCPSVDNRTFITERNGKVGIHYNTENSNKATGDGQQSLSKRKAIKPILDVIQYHFNTQIMPEFFSTPNELIDSADCPLEFVFDAYDPDEDMKELQKLKLEQDMGIKTPMMIAKERGINLEELGSELEKKKQEEADLFEQQNPIIPEQNPQPFQKVKPKEKSIVEKTPLSELNSYIDGIGKDIVKTLEEVDDEELKL